MAALGRWLAKGKDGQWRLQGLSGHRRIVILRRPIKRSLALTERDVIVRAVPLAEIDGRLRLGNTQSAAPPEKPLALATGTRANDDHYPPEGRGEGR